MEQARDNLVDAAKLLAAFGVVMIHLAPSTQAAEIVSRIFLTFVVPFFLTTALFFFINKVFATERLRIVHLRLDRIFVPYVVWTLIFLVL